MNNFKKLTDEIKSKMLDKFSGKEFIDCMAKAKAAEDTGRFKVVISTEDRDRQGEVVLQSGWDFTNYKNNPTVLWAHNYYDLPVGVTENIYTEDGKTIAEGRFASHAFAQDVRKLYEGGMLPATSVGFIVREMEGNVITKAELLEFSFVPVPANPGVRDLAKELGINMEEMITKGVFSEEIKTQDTPIEEPVIEEVKEEEVIVEDPKPQEEEKKEDDEVIAEEVKNFIVHDKEKGCFFEIESIDGKKTLYKLDEGSAKTFKEMVFADTEMKAGRVLSEKNRTTVQSAIEGMKSACTALEDLLVASEGGEGKSLDVGERSIPVAGSTLTYKEIQTISEDSKKVLQLIAHITSESLANIKKVKRN